MLPDFKMIVHKFPARPDIEIWPISDVHLGAAEHNADAWSNFCKQIQAEDNAYVLLLGDLLNNCTRSSISDIWREVLTPRQAKKLMVEMLEPLKSKILAAVTGNHERRSVRETSDDPTYDIMCKLDIEHLYREDIAFVKIQMGDNKNGSGLRNPTYTIVMTHGAGGCIYTGATVNRAERAGYYIDGADVIILGHSHKPFVTQPAKIKINPQQDTVYFRPFKVISATSWLDYGGYAAQKMLPPSSIAPQVLKLYGRKKKIEVTM